MRAVQSCILLTGLALWVALDGREARADAAKVCVLNASQNRHFFAAEVTGAARVTGWLAPMERLCAEGGVTGDHGVVSVYEDDSGFEGCSRLVPVGKVEELRRWSAFDRCLWGSHGS